MSDFEGLTVSDSEDETRQAGPRQKRVRMRDVNMPSGKKVSVTIPAKSCSCTNKCAFDLRLTELRPEGIMGSREYKLVANEMASTIRQHANRSKHYNSYEILKIEKVQNCCLWKKFRNQERLLAGKNPGYCNELMLFHGSKAADTIVKTGFDKNCLKPGGSLGTGIYFSKNSSKSNHYVFGYSGDKSCPEHKEKCCYVCERKLMLCRVTLGRMHKLKEENKNILQPPQSHNSVAGEPSPRGFKYPEFVIFNGDQAYPEYLITYKIVQ